MVAQDNLTAGNIALRLTEVLVLVLANGFFVAAEFALVGANRGRIDQAAAAGDRSARRVQQALDRLDLYIASAQLGITLASLALGWIGEQTLALLIDRVLHSVGINAPPVAAHSTAAIITAYVVLTFLHITIGEQTPKSIGIVAPERLSKIVVRPLMWFTRVMLPFIWFLNTVNNWLVRLLGIPIVTEKSHGVHSPEELRFLVMQARAHGTLDESDTAMLAGVFDFHNKKARDVMRPRTEVVAIPDEATEDDVWDIIRRERYSRYPVYHETLDDVVGVFLAKDLWLREEGQQWNLRQLIREALYVPHTLPAELVLDRLRKTRAHMAVVLDEYGGTEGILTIEDLVEEVIGDIADEYDIAARTSFEMDGVLELAGSLSLVDVRSDYGIPIPDGEWTTLGGYAFSQIGRLPKVGDRARFPGGELEIVAMDGRRVAALRIHRNGASPQPA